MKIAIVTGTRAEYGIFRLILKKLNEDKDIELQILVTGTHLSPEFGHTYKFILEDNFKIDKYIELSMSSDSSIGVSKSIGLGLISFSEALNELKPDLLLLVGDRFEIFAAASAAMISRIPIAHIHGGESTVNTIDESIRHSITKMSHIHFTSTEVYLKRVIQLGEKPSSVYNFGAPGIENIKKPVKR